MSHLLNFISSFGSSAELRTMPVAQLRQQMQAFGLSAAEIAVFLSGDRHAVAEMLKTSGDIVCCIVPEQPVTPPQPDQPPTPSKDDDDEDKQQKALLARAG